MHSYYYVTGNSLSIWTPTNSTPLKPVHGDLNSISDIIAIEKRDTIVWCSSKSDAIWKADINGQNPVKLYNTKSPESVAAKGSSLLWLSGDNEIWLGSLESVKSSKISDIPNNSSTVNHLKFVTSHTQDKWSVYFANGKAIMSAEEPSDADQFTTLFSHPNSKPIYIAIDILNSFIYWVDAGLESIGRCDYKGDNAKPNYCLLHNIRADSIRGMVINPYSQKIYVIGSKTGENCKIYRLSPEKQEDQKTVSDAPHPSSVSWGLALRHAETHVGLISALKSKEAAYKNAQSSITSAHQMAEQAIQSAQNLVLDERSKADKSIAAARKKADAAIEVALKKKIEAEESANQSVSAARHKSNEKIAKAQNQARKIVSDARKKHQTDIEQAKNAVQHAREEIENTLRRISSMFHGFF